MKDSDTQKLRKQVRNCTLCGACKSASLLIWEWDRIASVTKQRSDIGHVTLSNTFEHDFIPRFSTEGERSEEVTFGLTVRCAFYKMNVPDPVNVLSCDGFKAINTVPRDGAECVRD